jgi:hypothetical protein
MAKTILFRTPDTERMNLCYVGYYVQVGGRVVGQVARYLHNSGLKGWRYCDNDGKVGQRMTRAEAIEGLKASPMVAKYIASVNSYSALRRKAWRILDSE